ncbi:FMN-dependent NADH-azoreductase [Ruegeria sp. EL01]|jgi:FMN-dependent NADH-azoreductase|uniref:FMN-dependent NADH-azoreductase n=1 Tax=Ruegeria sp. EL01 TaxID=2107578 RepID=UPI000EA817AB|nr:NAD(P)H-dependent oxidoreductase [Ruegeria sp. EL01]
MSNPILRIDASVRHTGSHSRDLADRILTHIDSGEVVTRDLAAGLPLINNDWVTANLSDPVKRSLEQNEFLKFSDSLIEELVVADTIVISFPVYNFGIPAVLKAWLDLVCRFGLTFTYSDKGPEGLLQGKRAIIAMASGYTGASGEGDFASTHLRYVLGFLGITDVDLVAVDQTIFGEDEALARSVEQIQTLRR